MKRLATVAALVLSLTAVGGAEAAVLPCGLPETQPLWVEFADTSVQFRQEIFGRPGLVLASAGVAGPAELRARGAQTVYWLMKLQTLVGTPTQPADPGSIPAAAESLFQRAAASSGCATPVIALNELFGVHRTTPWLFENYQYRANVLSLLKALAAKGAVPYLLVPGKTRGPRAPFVDGDARAWWLEASRHAVIVRQVHFNAPFISKMGALIGSRTRRIAMRDAVSRFLAIGIPADRMGLLLGFQSGLGKGGREGLEPAYAWFEIVKQDALAARQVSGELGLGSIWSWGWGTFGPDSVDADKPRAACVYLWTRDPSLCDGLSVAGSRFDASLSVGQILLPPGIQCRTGAGLIESAAVDELAGALSGRTAALTVLLNRLIYQRERVDPRAADVDAAEAAVIERGFSGDAAAYEDALERNGLSRSTARELIADQLRRQAFEATIQVRYVVASAEGYREAKQRAALRTAICLRDELPGRSLADPSGWLPFLAVRQGSVSIATSHRRVRPGGAILLSGTARSERASELVTVYVRGVREARYSVVGRARVGADGRWTLRVKPHTTAYYRAVSKSAASLAISIRVKR